MISKQIGKLFKKGGKNGRKKIEGKDIRTKNRGMVVKKKGKSKAKKICCRYDLGKVFQIGHGKAFKIDGTICNPKSLT